MSDSDESTEFRSGQCLWWHYPVQEAPYVGSPLDTAFDDNWHTWWTPLPSGNAVQAAFERIRETNTARVKAERAAKVKAA